MPCMISWAKHCHVVLAWIGMYWGWSLSHREMRPHSLDGLEDSGFRLRVLNKYTSTGCRSVPFSPSNYTHRSLMDFSSQHMRSHHSTHGSWLSWLSENARVNWSHSKPRRAHVPSPTKWIFFCSKQRFGISSLHYETWARHCIFCRINQGRG